jgi:hypothetical protein
MSEKLIKEIKQKKPTLQELKIIFKKIKLHLVMKYMNFFLNTIY